MGVVIDENRARRTPCKCYIIDPAGPRDDPDNLLCFSEGIVGSLSDTQDRDFCTEREVHPPSERFAKHIRKFKLWGVIAEKCLELETEKEYLECVSEEAKRLVKEMV